MNIRNIILVVVATQFMVKAETRNGSEIQNLINLGQVDGKNYFYDKTHRNWTDSGRFCEESGMQLATIETVAQATFLKSKFNSDGFKEGHWTAARDAHLPRQFTWNSTGTAPTDSIGLPLGIWYPREYQTCVFYYASASPSLYLHPCADELFVLCQT